MNKSTYGKINMTREDYDHITLPSSSLVANPMFIPYFGLKPVIEPETNITKNTRYPKLNFYMTNNNPWISFFFEDNYRLAVINEGSLAKLTIESEHRQLFDRQGLRVNYESSTIEQLLREGLLIKTDYETAFSNLGILEHYQEELANINKLQNVVYQVPHEKFERDGAVALLQITKNKSRGKIVKDALKELLDNLLPQPEATPQRR